MEDRPVKHKSFDLHKRLKSRHIELLAALSSAPTLSAAAAHVHLSQPAATKLLKSLSADLGMPLFSRVGRVLRPTEAGRTLIFHSRRLMSDLERAQIELNAVRSGASGRTVLGALSATCHVVVPTAIALLRDINPGVMVQLREGTMPDLLPALRENRIDLVIGRLDPLDPDINLLSEVLYDVPIRVVVGPNHPLAHARKVRWQQLLDEEWILPPVNTPMRSALETVFRGLAASPSSIAVESAAIEANVELLARWPMTCVMSENVATAYQRAGRLRILPLPSIPGTEAVSLVRLRGVELSSATQALVECLQQVGQELSRDEHTRRRAGRAQQ